MLLRTSFCGVWDFVLFYYNRLPAPDQYSPSAGKITVDLKGEIVSFKVCWFNKKVHPNYLYGYAQYWPLAGPPEILVAHLPVLPAGGLRLCLLPCA
jgi:signal peptidase I